MENNKTPGKPTLIFSNKQLTKWITTAISVSLLAITGILVVKINQILFSSDELYPMNSSPTHPEKVYTISPPPTAFILQQIEDSIIRYKNAEIEPSEKTIYLTHWEDQLAKVRKLEDYQLRLFLNKDDPDFDSVPYRMIIEELESSLELAIKR